VSSWIQVDTEGVAFYLAWLRCVLRCSEGQDRRLGRVHILDRHVEVKLLGPLVGRPRGRRKLVGLLERQAKAVHLEDDPVVLGKRDLSAEDTSVELGERPRVRAVEDHGAHSGKRHGQQVFHDRGRSAARPATGAGGAAWVPENASTGAASWGMLTR
jgi:hypothetical protein